MSWLSWVGGKRNNKDSARDAIIGLREQLHLISKKEEHLLTKIDDELRKAKTNVTGNKRGASMLTAAQAALRQKKVYENELDRLAGTRMTLETQVNAIENANMNIETMRAMQRGFDALKGIHGSMNIDKVDNTMDSIREQMALTNEISDAISNPVGMGAELDEVRDSNKRTILRMSSTNSSNQSSINVSAARNRRLHMRCRVLRIQDRRNQMLRGRSHLLKQTKMLSSVHCKLNLPCSQQIACSIPSNEDSVANSAIPAEC